MTEPVVGIDLGTTNSSVAAVRQGRPRLLLVDGEPLLPSVVALGADGSMLVGQSARNQQMLFPERTIASVKRRMGEEGTLSLGEQQLTPVEVSAVILRRLKAAAEEQLEQPVRRAVITVPAYFSDRQRTATREAGEVAGLEVVRVLHEPTAAALCYGEADEGDRVAMVYDLGGGTFDVSIVRRRGGLTEVLASHGDTALGGDDFDAALLAHLRRTFEQREQVSLEGDLRALARLRRAAEAAKITLSTESYAEVIEEHLTERDGRGLHLELELPRHEYEAMIRPLVEKTTDSVQTALHEAGLLARDLDEVILVGGSTRTPMIAEMLRQMLELPPRMEVDPEKAVALGAALAAARAAGESSGQILVDVTPFTFGTSYVGRLRGAPYDACFKGIIKRNTPLPTRQTEVFYTIHGGQRAVDVEIYQGESDDARDNLRIGRFLVEGLDRAAPSGSPILFDFSLDLDGILAVEVIEKHTGLAKGVVIEDAFRRLTNEELDDARQRISALLGGSVAELDLSAAGPASPATALLPTAPDDLSEELRAAWSRAVDLVQQARGLAPTLEGVDRGEVEEVAGQLTEALERAEVGLVTELADELSDILFYLEE